MAESKSAPAIVIVPNKEAADLYVDLKSGENSGVDIRFPRAYEIQPGATQVVDFGVTVACEVEPGGLSLFWFLPRSSIGKTTLCLVEGRSLLGPGPEGLKASLYNFGKEAVKLERGAALFQVAERWLTPPECRVLEKHADKQGWGLPEHKTKTRFTVLPSDVDPTPLAAGKWADAVTLPANRDYKFPPGAVTDVPLGLAAGCRVGDSDETIAYWLWLNPNDEAAVGLILMNKRGLIDRGYRGELRGKVYNPTEEEIVVKKGSPLFIMRSAYARSDITIEIVKKTHPDFLSGATLRGTGAFGSTGAGGAAK